MSTLIIGCGYLGERVGAQLRHQGESVYGTVRSPSRADQLATHGIEPVIADVLDRGSLNGLPRVDRIFYCVGFDRASGHSMRSVYVDGLQNVLDCLKGVVLRFVYASSTGVYGQTDGEWVDEASTTSPPNESGRVCLEAEGRLGAWTATNCASASTVILRFAGLYGPGRVVRRSILERGEAIPGDPGKFLNMIQIDDAARAAVAALFSSQADTLYVVCDDRPVTRLEYYTRMAALLGTPPPRFESPAPGSPESARDATNKRVTNRRIMAGLKLTLQYPDITTGLTSCVDHAKAEP